MRKFENYFLSFLFCYLEETKYISKILQKQDISFLFLFFSFRFNRIIV